MFLTLELKLECIKINVGGDILALACLQRCLLSKVFPKYRWCNMKNAGACDVMSM